MANNLTTLENVRAWIGSKTTTDDALLTRMIGASSRMILSYLERPTMFKAMFADVYDAVGQRSQQLRQSPVLSVKSLAIGSRSIPASPGAGQPGFVLDGWNGYPPGSPQAVSLNGYCFGRSGIGAVAITYYSGFVVQNEPQTVPAAGSSSFNVDVDAPHGSWAVDEGVTYANGTVMTAVNDVPQQGQYSVDEGEYTFNSADAGASVLISYSYIPADIEQACIEMVAERYAYKDRVGVVSKSLGGQETVSFSQKNMPDYVMTLLNPYKSVIPV